MVGILYLGQYQNGLIETKLENFENEVLLISEAVSGASTGSNIIAKPNTENILRQFSGRTGHRVLIFNTQGQMLIDSNALKNKTLYARHTTTNNKKELESVRVLKNAANFIVKLLPETRELPLYPDIKSTSAHAYPDALAALLNQTSFSAWQDDNGTILLSASAPIYTSKQILGAVLITRKGQDIENALTQVWINILQIFLGTLLITTFLSIYLSGVIAKPLRRLARAAEAMRKGQSKGAEDIPDLSHRYDEIGELSVALRSMTQALWERMDAIEEFAADVAHELKNPLTSLKSALETLEKINNPEDKEKLIDIIRHDLKRMDRLITDISSASRLDAELSREAFTPVDLKTTLQRLVDLYEDPLLEKNKTHKQATISLSHENNETFRTLGLEDRLGQVFRNIIDNALSFAPENSAITINLQKRDRKIIVTIEDEGKGIPANKIKTIFERFYSERPQEESYGNNSGLGLSICKQIISAHNGEIFAENITDENESIHGARFNVILNSA